MIGKVLLLDNNEKYIVTSNCNHEGEEYLLLTKLNADESVSSEVVIAKHFNGTVEIVDDNEVFKAVINKFDLN